MAAPNGRAGAGVSESGSAAWYEIRVDGLLDPSWTAWFGDLCVARRDTDTVISGLLVDQAALHGVLTKIRDLGLPLVSVTRFDHDDPHGHPAPRSDADD